MNICLIGYGKMGKAIEQAARECGHVISSRIDNTVTDADHTAVTSESLRDCSVVIDFSSPLSIIERAETVVSAGIPLVIGTTGWDIQPVRDLTEKMNGTVICDANFSVGMQVFYLLLEHAAAMMNGLEQYDVAGVEMHHAAKKDIPSGTAVTLSKIITETIDRKTASVFHPGNRRIEPHELHFASVRCGALPGEHRVMFDSMSDTITLTHTAKDRSGFAFGAVMAAEEAQKTTGFTTFSRIIRGRIEGGAL